VISHLLANKEVDISAIGIDQFFLKDIQVPYGVLYFHLRRTVEEKTPR